MKSKLLELQEIVIKQTKKIASEELKDEELQNEIARSNSITGLASTYIKSLNINIRVIELANKAKISKEELSKEIGV